MAIDTSPLATPPIILIAEDDSGARHILRRMLESEKYVVEEAGDGVEALKKVVLCRPDLVLLDGMMPGMNGFEVCQKMQTLPHTKETPVIMITALSDQDSIDRAFEAGAADYIPKPVQWSVLRKRVQRLLLVRRTQTELREERNLLRTLIDNLPDYIFVKDREGRFLESNLAHAQAAGAASGRDIVGKVAADLFPPELAAQYDTDDRAVMDSGQPLVNIERQTVRAGTRRIVLTTKVPIKSSKGESIGLVGISHDITQRKRMEAELIEYRSHLEKLVEERTAELSQANRALQLEIQERERIQKELQDLNRLKTEFLSTAAHELRTPLTSIRGFSEILLTRDLPPERHKKYMNFINEQATMLGQIIDDLLDLSRLEADRRLALSLQPMSMNELLVDVVAPFHEGSTLHHIELVGFADCPDVLGDPTRLAQVAKNLISNAIKYSPNGGTVLISGKAIDNYLQISVQDEGIGLTPEQQKHLFEKFYRADASNTAVGGTGLGLAISKSIIEMHGGKIWAESEYGRGSIFHISLPLAVTSVTSLEQL